MTDLSRSLEGALGAALALPPAIVVTLVLAGQGSVDMAAPLLISPAAVGWLVLMIAAVAAGGTYGAVYRSRPGEAAAAVGAGVTFGLLWWAVIWLSLLPLMSSGEAAWSVEMAATAFPFLIASVVGGMVTALCFHVVSGALVGGDGTDRMITPNAVGATHRIVIVGGGFGGVAAAQGLEQALRHRPAVAVTLISDRNYLLFTPMLVGVASGSLVARHVAAPLRATCPRTTTRQARVEAVDAQRQVVQIRPSSTGPVEDVPYDELILAVGAVPSFRGLTGLAERAFTLKTLADATDIRDHVLGLLGEAETEPSQEARQRLLTFVVAGGGFAGVELVAELYDLVHDVLIHHPRIDPGTLRFILVHSRDRILPELSEPLGRYSLDILRRRGIAFALGLRVEGATDDGVRLSDGSAVSTATFVWTAGNEAAPLSRSLIPAGGGATLSTDSTLRVLGHDHIWAVGDCAAIPDADGRPCPPTAQHALRQGHLAADNVLAAIDGLTLMPFRFRALGMLVILGRNTAAAEIRHVRFSGLVAWFMWRGIYLAKLPGFEKRLRVLIDWVLDLIFPRDIVIAGVTQPDGPVAPAVAPRVRS